ncbi:hypothetical protein NHQ30_003806 [Ciborinia camelliae]|nr:hypothetical protein NHQ30_003806 [Ciborinia camelliae]
MSRAPAELPGYYYGTFEKKKYFKIQANAPSKSAYSSQDVRKRKIDDENKKAQSLRVRRNVGRIKRARVLESPITGGFLSVGFGQSDLNAVSTSVYAQNLIRTGEKSFLPAPGGGLLFAAMPQKPELYDSSVRFTASPGESRGNVDILSSTSTPPSSQLVFVIGSSKGILLIDKNFDTSWMQRQAFEDTDSHPRDVFALEFLPNHNDILLTGERRGILNIIDLRLPRFGPSTGKIQHTSCITHIKSLDEHRILVAGCASDLCQYDKRFTKPNTHLAPLINTKNINPPTTSYLTYPDYQNNGKIHVGLDVDLELGIVAAADHESKIRLFSLHGGQVLNGFNFLERPPDRPGPDLSRRDTVQVSCIKFVQDTRNKPKSLWAAVSDHIVRLSFDRKQTPSSPQDFWRSNLYNMHVPELEGDDIDHSSGNDPIPEDGDNLMHRNQMT